MNHRTLILALVLSLCGRAVGGGDEVSIAFPPPPRLAITAAQWQQRQQSSNFAAQRDAEVAKAQAILDAGLTVPRGYADWIFYYANPRTGGKLEPISLTEHRDPATGEVFRDDEKINGGYRMRLHDRLNNDVLQLAWAYRYSGADRFAAAARDALLQLAADYASYPGRRDRWGRRGLLAPLGGRRYTQSLSEATGVLPLAQAYDLCRDSAAWTEAQRRTVEQEFFAATAKTLLRFNQDINNHQTWYNAGLMAIANVLGDEALVRRVLDMRGGFHDQLRRSVGDDGLWYEGTMAYHFYALDAMTRMVDAAAPLGLALHDQPRLRAMFDAPMQAAYPDGQFPAINDSDRLNIGNYRRLYVWAQQRYGDGRYAEPLKHLATGSLVMKDSGLAILRRGQGDGAICAMLDFGPHGAGHGHFDKLQLLLFARGREWLHDPGRLTYSHPEYHTWVKQTAAHNTVAIDGRSQGPTTGTLRWWQDDKDVVACEVESRGAYGQAVLRRTLVLSDRWLVDRFDVLADREVSVDWFSHIRASAVQGPTWEPFADALGEKDGYQHLTSVRQATGLAGGALRLRCTAENVDDALAMWLAVEPGDRLLLADSIGYSVAEKVPCLVWRRQVCKGVLVVVYDLVGEVRAVGLDGGVVRVLEGDRWVEVRLRGAGVEVTR